MKKIIIGSMIGLIIIASCIFVNQERKINELEYSLQVKQQQDERHSDTTYTVLNAKKIQEKFNEVGSYSILKNSKANQTHTYNFEEEALLGFKKKATLKGSANLVYDYDILLSSADIQCDVENNTITVLIDQPYLDEQSVHMELDSLVITEDKHNILCGNEEGRKVEGFFRDSFVEEGTQKLLDYYSSENKKNKLNQQAITQVKKLVETLNLTNVTVIVKIK